MGTSDIGGIKPLVQRTYLGGSDQIEAVSKSNAKAEMDAINDLQSGKATTQQIADRLGLATSAVELLKITAGRYASSDGTLSAKAAESLQTQLAADEQNRAFFLKHIIDSMFSKILKNFGG